MRILILLIILLCFPAMEIYTLFHLAGVIGWWLAAWLLASALAGFALIQEEKLAFFGRLFVAVQSGQTPLAALFESGKTLVAGVLLIFPGAISDALALVLLLIPAPRRKETNVVPRDDVIEGSYRREE